MIIENEISLSLSFKKSELNNPTKLEKIIGSFVFYLISKVVSQITRVSDKALEVLVNTINIDGFSEKVKHKDLTLMVLPSLCKSTAFIKKLK